MYLILFIILIQTANAQVFIGKPNGTELISSSNSSFEQEVLQLVNKERRKRKLILLQWDSVLCNAARYHANDMAIEGYFDHYTKDKLKNGRFIKVCDFGERMDAFLKHRLFSRSENIAYGQIDPKEVMSVWMKSKDHRNNILDRKAKFLGVGYIELAESTGKRYWVQSFGI